jgi:hypothetical protein
VQAIVSGIVLTAAVTVTLSGLTKSLARPARPGFLGGAASILEAGVCLLLILFCAALLILRIAMLLAP